MTNLELFDKFKEFHPEFQLVDWRPIIPSWIPNDVPGIMIWGKDGDLVIWFPSSK